MASFFPLLSLLILIAFSILTPLVYRLRRSLAVSWLVALSGALIAWVLILVTGFNLPMTITLIAWHPQGLFPESPVWLVDQISWPFAFGLTTLALVVILTDVAREFEAESNSWASSLALTALGLASIFSGNSVTLLLSWAALDLIELIYWLQRLHSEADVRKAVAVFSARAAGIVSFLVGVVFAADQGFTFQFDRIPQISGIFFLAGISLRLGVFPSHAPFWREAPLRRGIGTVARIVPPVASLVILARVADSGLSLNQTTLIFFFSGIAAIYAGISWYYASDELEGRPYFILCVAALAFGSAIRGQQPGSLTWGLSLVFGGGFIFLYSSRGRIIGILALVFALGFVTLPYTPSWFGGQLYASRLNLWHVLYLVAQVFLVVGYIQHSRREGEILSDAERWVRLIYPSGLAILLVAQYIAGWLSGYLIPDARWSMNFFSLLPGMIVLLSVAAWIRFARRIPRFSFQAFNRIRNIFSLGWFYLVLAWVFKVTERAVRFTSLVLEGEGGVLWALLLLILLIAFLSGGGGVGG